MSYELARQALVDAVNATAQFTVFEEPTATLPTKTPTVTFNGSEITFMGYSAGAYAVEEEHTEHIRMLQLEEKVEGSLKRVRESRATLLTALRGVGDLNGAGTITRITVSYPVAVTIGSTTFFGHDFYVSFVLNSGA